MQNQMTSFSTPNNIPIHHHQPPHTFITDHNLNHKYTKRVNNNNYNNDNNKNVLLRVSGAGQACAACKYQRRKCAPDCVLAPYFPHDRQRQFLNAHKLFGVSNITKIIRHLDQPLKDEAMRTIIFQSDVRANDPVGGCYRIIRDLQRHIDYCKAELDIVLHQLAYCRAQAVAAAASSQTVVRRIFVVERSARGNFLESTDFTILPKFSTSGVYFCSSFLLSVNRSIGMQN